MCVKTDLMGLSFSSRIKRISGRRMGFQPGSDVFPVLRHFPPKSEISKAEVTCFRYGFTFDRKIRFRNRA